MSSSALANFELLVVSNDYSTLKTLVGAWRETGNHLESTPSITYAHDFVQKRKTHGIVIDMQMKGALEFVRQLKQSRDNAGPIIVACAGTPQEERAALAAGANFVVQKPISTGRIFDLLTLSGPIQGPQRRRYLRHRLVAPVTIFSSGLHYRALISDLSESGMSIRSTRRFGLRAPVEFNFELRSNAAVAGEGRIVWTDDSGFAGIQFDTVRCAKPVSFPVWLDHHSVLLRSSC